MGFRYLEPRYWIRNVASLEHRRLEEWMMEVVDTQNKGDTQKPIKTGSTWTQSLEIGGTKLASSEHDNYKYKKHLATPAWLGTIGHQ